MTTRRRRQQVREPSPAHDFMSPTAHKLVEEYYDAALRAQASRDGDFVKLRAAFVRLATYIGELERATGVIP